MKPIAGIFLSIINFLQDNDYKDLNRITRMEILDYIEQMKNKGAAPSSVARSIVSIRMWHTFMFDEGLLVENVTTLIESPKLWMRMPKGDGYWQLLSDY